jgi:hypothetical protein
MVLLFAQASSEAATVNLFFIDILDLPSFLFAMHFVFNKHTIDAPPGINGCCYEGGLYVPYILTYDYIPFVPLLIRWEGFIRKYGLVLKRYSIDD